MPEINRTGKKWRPGNRGGGVVVAMGVVWVWLEEKAFLAAKGLEEAFKVDLGKVIKGQDEVIKGQEEVKLGKAMEEAEAVGMEMEEAKLVGMEMKGVMEEAEVV